MQKNVPAINKKEKENHKEWKEQTKTFHHHLYLI
jgi:hypothetical protein